MHIPVFQASCPRYLPEGRYLAIIRAKDTNQVENDLYVDIYNKTDGEKRSERNQAFTLTLTSEFAYYTEVFDITADDAADNDTIEIYLAKNKTDANSIYVDYFLIIPIGNGESWPQDLAHNAMRTFTKYYKVYKR